jgi:hypothetical protein
VAGYGGKSGVRLITMGAVPRTLPFQSTMAPAGAVWMAISTGLGCARLISGSGLGCGAAQAVRSRAERMAAAGIFMAVN